MFSRCRLPAAVFTLCLAGLLWNGPAQAQIRPSSDLLLPYFEVSLDDFERTTLFSVVNASRRPVDVLIEVHSNWGVPLLASTVHLEGDAVQSVNLRDWLIFGILPDRTLGPAELAHLQAALSGERSPKDGLYYGTEVIPRVDVGFVTMRTAGEDVIWGDSFVVDLVDDYSQGETLVNIDPALECQQPCTRHAVRFLEAGGFDAGTEVIVWTGRQGSPSAEPVYPAAQKVYMDMTAFDEAGHVIDAHGAWMMPVERMRVADMHMPEPFGWLEIETEEPSFVGVRFSSHERYSVALHSYCLEEEAGPGPTGPALRLEKLTNGAAADFPPGPELEIGESILWEYVVTNAGAVPLSGITVTDDKGVAVTCPGDTLQPGESMTCTGNGTAVACQYVNVGTVRAKPPTGRPLVARDPSHYVGRLDATLALVKKVNGQDAGSPPGPILRVGDAVAWTFLVTNTGAVRLDPVTVADPSAGAVSCPKKALDPGESMTCTANGTAVAGLHGGMATVTGQSLCGPVTAEDPAYYTGEWPDVSIEKLVNGQDADTPPGPMVLTGSATLWTYVVTNVGDVPLTQVAVTDDKGLVVTCPKTTLAPDESMTCTASGTAVAGQHVNVGTVTGKPPTGPNVTASDPSCYLGVRPELALEKLINGQDADTPPGPMVAAGTQMTWAFVVTNTGDVTLTNVAVTDDVTSPDDDITIPVACPKTTLAPGESMTCVSTGTAVHGQHRDLGTATAQAPVGPALEASDPAHYFCPEPAIAVEKLTNGHDADTPPGPEMEVGSAVLWTYVVTNMGDVALTQVAVTDDRGVAVTCPKTALEPGESMTCTGSGTATAGQYANMGTASGMPPVGSPVTASDPSHYMGMTAGNQGCTPGYWKNHTGSWPPTGYSPSQAVDSVFAAVNTYFPSLGDASLLQALGFGGGPGLSGAAEILLRAAVAAVLNASHPGVAYPRTESDVIASVNTSLSSGSRDAMLVLAAALDADNNRGCPLN